jgi:4-hydroxybutyrate CoA-transferase
LTSRARPSSIEDDAKEAVAGIRSGERVFIGTGAAEPDSLVEALTARAGTLRDVRLVHALTFGPARYVVPEHAQSFRVTTFFIAPNLREAVADGRADFVPVFLHETGRLCQDLDWALVQLSPPDRHGFCSTGVSADITVHAIRAARHVVAEINPRMPRTLGDTLVHVDRLAAVTGRRLGVDRWGESWGLSPPGSRSLTGGRRPRRPRARCPS